MRSFLAIDLPPQVLDALEMLQRRLPVGRPAPRDTLHLTIAFLGDQPDRLIADADDALQGLEAPGFDLQLAGLDVFGTPDPGILFIGATKSDALDHLRRKVRSLLRGVGFELRRERFRPHVTLARFAHHLPSADIERLAAFLSLNAGLSLDPFAVRELSLFRSTLRREGAVHEELARYPLA